MIPLLRTFRFTRPPLIKQKSFDFPVGKNFLDGPMTERDEYEKYKEDQRFYENGV